MNEEIKDKQINDYISTIRKSSNLSYSKIFLLPKNEIVSLLKKPIVGKEEEQNIIELKSSFIPPINSNENNDTKERLNTNKENNNTINSIF